MSQLERQRLPGNILDEVEALKRKVRLLEETAAAADASGAVRMAGLHLRVRESTPSAPPAGIVLIYAQEVGGYGYLRAMDSTGVVRELMNWTPEGDSLIIRDRVDESLWRLFIDVHAPGVLQLGAEALEAV